MSGLFDRLGAIHTSAPLHCATQSERAREQVPLLANPVGTTIQYDNIATTILIPRIHRVHVIRIHHATESESARERARARERVCVKVSEVGPTS